LQRHLQQIPNYEQVKALGGTVGHGLIEKAKELVVVRRMEDGPMQWTKMFQSSLPGQFTENFI